MNDKRAVMSACEFSITSLQNIKKGMMDSSHPKHAIIWAIGSIIVTLSSNLISISQDVIQKAANTAEPDAIEDLKEIQTRFNEFMDRMIGNE